MTGEPAETSRKFRFTTAPVWAVVFLFLICVGIGFFVSLPMAYLVGQHASGPLPLTRRSKRLLEIPIWAGVASIAFWAIDWIVAAIAFSIQHDPANPSAALVGLFLFYLGLPGLVLGVVLLEIGFQLGTLPYGPRAKVRKQEPGQPDRVVELLRLHPAFVAAVLDMQRSRAGPDLSLPPGSN
jgi:hypothetical protein